MTWAGLPSLCKKYLPSSLPFFLCAHYLSLSLSLIISFSVYISLSLSLYFKDIELIPIDVIPLSTAPKWHRAVNTESTLYHHCLIKQIYRSFDYKKTFDLQTLKAAVALWIIVPQSRVWGHYMSPPPQIVLEIFLDGTSDHVGHTWRKKSLFEYKNTICHCPRSNQMS